MFDNSFYSKLEEVVQDELSCSAHDLSHVYRVYKNACHIATQEKADLHVIKTAALLHDIARVKEDEDTRGQTDHAVLGADMAEKFLKEMQCKQSFIEKVKGCILHHRYKGENIPQTLEEKIVFDADKLDILGAVGLARSYMIAGEYGQMIYNDIDIGTYIKGNLTGGSPKGRIKDMKKHSANLEFELKMKKLPERMFTETAKEIAHERLAFMETFFATLRREMTL